MDSEEDDMIYEEEDEDSAEASNDDDYVDIAMEPEPSTTADSREQEHFPYEVLTADRIVHVMVECIKEVNAVVQEMTGLECGHKFCHGCWTDYLTSKIVDEGMGQTIACAAYGCDILVDDVTVMNLITDARVRLKYQHLITNSFVECNRMLRWCPAPDCGHVVKVQHFDVKPVQCACGHIFCFACGENWHDPECPKCHVTIEKDGGCNHMICKNQNCKADFCWVCLGPWEPHGSSWYNCNRYDEDDAKKARDNQERSRCQLQRYLFYCNRYMNHMQSLKFENKLYASVKLKMEEMQQHSMSWIEVQFLKMAENQKDLEHATEHLSEYLEREITSELLVDIKQKVQDKYRYCESRRKVLLDHVHEGYEKEIWEYQDML
ncbi:ARI1-like protein [Mya arenaria]|uniref:RBR-type E3 ubiquitin transferase n=1 Tax=Mya arenaria TaxID=6604 RepID=A0ABY7DSX1_MYAAR|nr:ARI1-like protein [Mya arenaria]